ncbi:MAG: metal ABC transporter permease [Alphaproteobacteria bacterium]
MSLLSPEMLGLLAPAFFAGLAVSVIHVPLGQEVLKRGIIFIDLAIAQIAAMGVVCARIFLGIDYGSTPYFVALAFALLGSALFAWLGRKAPQYQEAFIGCSFVIAASLILIFLANDPHGGEQVEGLLAGQILWVGWQQTLMATALYAAAAVAWFLLPQRRHVLFYILFPVVVTLSVQLVGVYLVFASLILPALGAVPFSERHQLAAGYAIAFLAVLSGLIVSVIADLPAGPMLVCSFAALAFVLSTFKALQK